MNTSNDNPPLAERFADPATGSETRARLAELGDMIGNDDPDRIAEMVGFADTHDSVADYEARIRELYVDLFG